MSGQITKRFTGNDVRQTREALGLDTQQLAKFLCVAPHDVHLWEIAGSGTVAMWGYTPEILTKLQTMRLTKKLGSAIAKAVAEKGALAGLQVLLERR